MRVRRQLILDTDGLTNLFKEIKEKERIADLSVEYQKFAEWLRIESVLQLDRPRLPLTAF